jgi:hypothetical protein
VKHGLGRRNCGPNLPLIIMLIVVAAFYFKHHGVMAVTNETQSSQTGTKTTITSSDDQQSRGKQLEIAIKKYTNDLLDKQIDKFNEIVIEYSGGNSQQVESTLCATTADADNEAAEAAANLLLPHVRAAMAPKIAESGLLRNVVNDDWTKNQIKSSVSRGVDITDRHVDRIDKLYGTLWKETLAVNTSPSAIESNFAAPYLKLAEAQAAGRRNEWASLAGLAGVMILLYSFLNSATKGYFVWRLRAVATLVLIAAVLAIFALA